MTVAKDMTKLPSNSLQFHGLPAGVHHLTHLTKLSLSGWVSLGRLPNNLGSLRGLKEVTIIKSGLTSLSDALRQLTQLDYLNLTMNYLGR